jgi:hypothetical protein
MENHILANNLPLYFHIPILNPYGFEIDFVNTELKIIVECDGPYHKRKK